MINLYMTPRYKPSVQARRWLKKQGLIFKEVNLLKNPIYLREQLFQILPLLEGDVLRLVSIRSKHFKLLERNIDNLPLSQLLDYLVNNPRLLKQPIICDGTRVLIGFNADEIRVFVPKGVRRVERNLLNERILDIEQKKIGKER